MLTKSYNDAVKCENIVNEFTACGVWNRGTKTADPSVIRRTDITNWERAPSQHAAFTSYKELVQTFLTSSNLLRSDDEIVQNGTLVTTAGALLTNDDVIDRLGTRDDEKRKREEQPAAKAAAPAALKATREAEAVEKQRQKALEEEQNRLHILWLAASHARGRSFDANRAAGRHIGRQQAVRTAAASVDNL
ncbi:hypothetical protein FGB62_146g010 [Gracilaria domingensis]|nr:hypothetical protein FGB62_146g010 [Gracilaria domingensis]